MSDVKAPIQVVKEARGSESGSVFLIWSAAASGYKTATDTFIFDVAGKILHQNVVVHYEAPMKILHQNVVVHYEATMSEGPVHDAWDNHFSAFGAHDVDKILEDYTEKSIITVYNQVDGSQTVFTGLDGVKKCFAGLFKSLFDMSDIKAPIQVVKEASDSEPGSVFLIWSAAKSGYLEATDTFVFDADGKITTQNVVVTYQNPTGEKSGLEPTVVVPTGDGPVHDAWDNHFSAFGAHDVDKILKDYTDKSTITVYNQVDGSQSVFEGLDGVKDCFIGLFDSLFDMSDVKAPIQVVKEARGSESGSVFLIWSAAASGYKTATDTFIFDGSGKILRQNVVVHYKTPKDTLQ